MSDIKLNKQLLKEKWLNKYIKEMNDNQEKRDLERIHKAREEQEYLSKVQKELEEAKIRKHYDKLRIINDQLDDLNKAMIKKKVNKI